jgi:hypothetical protein
MAYHILCDVNRNKCFTVVNRYSQAHHIGNDHRSSGPGLDHRFFIALLRFLNFPEKFVKDVRSFLIDLAIVTAYLCLFLSPLLRF